MAEKSAGLYRNPISYVGGLIAAGSAPLIIGTVLVGFSLKQPSPYLGIFTYMIFPGFLVLGLAPLLLRDASGEPAGGAKPERRRPSPSRAST